MRQQQLQTEIARATFSALSREDWVTSWTFYSECAGSSFMQSPYVKSTGGEGSIPPVDPGKLWSQLRGVMADPVSGAWFSSELSLTREGKFSFSFNYDKRVYDGTHPGAPFEPPETKNTLWPDDEAWVEDLRKYPRSREAMPGWLVALVDAAAVRAANTPDPEVVFADALGAVTGLPERVAPLVGVPGWRDVFASVTDHTVARIRSGGYNDLADPGRQPVWGRLVSQLAEDVFSDVWAEVFAVQRVGFLVELWREWAGVLGKVEPAGVDDLDPQTLLELSLPGVAGVLLDDVQDVLGDVIQKQLMDRFGVEPD